MRNFIQPGQTLTVTAPYAVKSGEPFAVGAFFGVAAYDADTGASVEMCRTGVFTLPKPAATAISEGAPLYWDEAGGTLTTQAAVEEEPNRLVGAAALDATAASGTVKVLLDGVIRQ